MSVPASKDFQAEAAEGWLGDEWHRGDSESASTVLGTALQEHGAAPKAGLKAPAPPVGIQVCT